MTDLRQVNQDPWLQRLQSGEREHAIAELRSYLVRGLSRSLRHRYGGKVQIEDIVQVALLRILDSVETFQQRSRFETWAMAIAIRVGMSELRKRYYRDVSIDLTSSASNIRIEVVDPYVDATEDQADRQALLLMLQRLIDERLSDKQRLAIRGSLAAGFKTDGWKIVVDGLVDKPRSFTIDELHTLSAPQERIYRMRCVEAWSMVIPWANQFQALETGH